MKKVVIQKRVMDVQRRAFAGGIFLGLIFFVLTLGGKLFGIFSSPLNILLNLYQSIGYDISYFGIIIGAGYGFVTGFVLSFLHAKIYNLMPDKFK